MKVVTAEEMREIDRRAIVEFGIPGVVLMENAGRGAADVIETFMAEEGLESVLVVAGKGNNGGDGFVAARHLVNRGIDCEICLIGRKKEVKGDARINLDVAQRMGIEITEMADSGALFEALLGRFDLIVDALFGTGLSKPVDGMYRGIIEAINFSGLPVVSLDIPSGLDSTTGEPLGLAVEADLTVTFCLPKIGTVIHPGADYAGELVLVDIGAPYELLEDDGLKTALVLQEDVEDVLLPREADSHKGDYGHLLVVAGSTGKSGAAAMAADAAVRSGAGLVTVAAPAAVQPVLAVKLTEAMTEPIEDGGHGVLGEKALKKIMALMEGKDVLLLGPGISREAGTGKLVRSIVKALEVPAVIDADALWHLSGHLDCIKTCRAPLILTPHPGEMAHLLGLSTKEVQKDRIGTARRFAVKYGCWLVLKGARTIVASPDGDVHINTTGNPGMASGGTGDVLAGMIGALLGQHCTPHEAALLGVYLHGRAGDLAAEEKGEVSLTATDMIGKIPEAMKGLTGA